MIPIKVSSVETSFLGTDCPKEYLSSRATHFHSGCGLLTLRNSLPIAKEIINAMSAGIPELVWRAYVVNLFVYSELTLRFRIKSGRRCGTAERGKRRRNLLPPGASDVDVVDGAGRTQSTRSTTLRQEIS